MQIKAKHFISIILAFVVMICTAMTVSAVNPRMSDTSSVSVTLTFSGTTAYCDAKVTGADGTTSITDGHLVLTDSDGTVVGEWENLSSSSKRLTVSKSVSGLTKNETYTLTLSAKVNRNVSSEYVGNYISKKC
ncbi:MAG: Ig-like domain-containing protein [Oscillospiraceae bacterium]|nr:Ig-like domain-containing protein [Oscillospiraceae bacterium]